MGSVAQNRRPCTPGCSSRPGHAVYSSKLDTQFKRRRPMDEVTRILSAIEHGDPHAAEQLLPLVYDELRRLAAQKLAREKPG